MKWFHQLQRSVTSFFRRERLEGELEEEMSFHLEMQAEEDQERGIPPDEASYRARRQFGNATLLRQDSREVWGWAPVERLWSDLRYAVRTLRKSGGFAAVAVLTLALGIGANTAVFSVVNAVVFRPLPFQDPGRLAMLWERREKKGEDRVVVSPYNFYGWKDRSQSFGHMAAIAGGSSTISLGGEPTTIPGNRVTSDFFDTLGVQPLLGRLFLAEEQLHSGKVAILGYRLWQQLGGSRDLVGKTAQLNREAYLIVGIMPPSFTFPNDSQVWYPLPESAVRAREDHELRVIGKLKPGAELQQARSELDTIAAGLRQAQPQFNPVTGVTIVSLQEQIVGDSRQALVVLLGAVGCVLLIACANVANLLLTRASGRKREIALRLALGASRWRVVRSLLVESVLLAMAGGLLGVAWAQWGVHLFVAVDPLKLPRIHEIAVDSGMLLFTLVVAVSTGVLFGLAPALRVSRPDLNETLKDGSERQVSGGGVGQNRLRSVLAVAQIALAIVLLTGAGLLLRSFIRRISVPLGFRPEGVLSVELPWSARKQIDPVLERIRALPGVRSAGAATALPNQPPETNGGFNIQGAPREGEELIAGKMLATPNYFRTAGMTLQRGRLTAEGDGPDAPKVAVVNETLVRKYFHGENPIGRNVQSTDGKLWRTVVGVVSDVKGFGVDGDPIPTVYLPYRQEDWNNGVHVIVRTVVPPAALASAIRKEIRAIGKGWIVEIDTIEGLLAESVAVPRFYLVLVGALAALAMVLAAIGIYGVIGYAVAQRTHEIGVRMALGADRGDVLFMVIREGLAIVLAGVAVGLAGAWMSTRALENLLFQVHAGDAGSFAGACLLLVAAALLACYLPARSAT